MNAEMDTDPQQILDDVEAALASLPGDGSDTHAEAGAEQIAASDGLDDIDAIDALGRRLEQAHQILVDALESVEKG